MFEHVLLKESIVVKGYMPHADSVRQLFQSDALLMIVDDFPGNEEIVPGKVYEYIGAGKPIIALAPEGAVAEVIRETGSGRICRSDDVKAVADIIALYYAHWIDGTIGLEQDRTMVRQFERREVTRRLAALLDDVTDKTKDTL